jgi:hypothetical protein
MGLMREEAISVEEELGRGVFLDKLGVGAGPLPRLPSGDYLGHDRLG